MRYLLSIFCFLCIAGWGPFYLSADTNPLHQQFSDHLNFSAASANPEQWVEKQTQVITAQANNLDPKILKLSLHAYLKARNEGKDQKQVLTVVDYSKPSSERRLWVIDVKHTKVLFNTWVAHGKNSGKLNATSFSNEANSLKTSLGVFVTRQTYMGKNGYSLRVDGLERGINDNALSRNVVFHGAPYAGGDVAKTRGQLGRSWGCMAVGKETIRPLVDTIKDDTVVVAYYPDHKWLSQSSFVHYQEV